ncbi:MAG: UDP-3-O-(3-hydroxymyristoyl)glucosamine N-acyltransferase [Deltaproteobacteria bacterium RIFCSPHIGHO2_02_FULL_40_11]|nr:MAG: UDP-3-O-(3-hydroxymyristoyl)glucosamine N-acyltransferase [Deltaproteobacteria bacterium RIFCSPHIGHO2_02_FULL_40_11]
MSKSIQEIAAHIQATLEGDATLQIQSVSSMDTATEHDLVFLADEKYATHLKNSPAKAVITHQKLDLPKTQLIVANPRLGFAKALELFDRPKDVRPGIHPKAWVEEGVELDPTVTVYPFVTIRKGAKISKNVILYPGTYIGQNVKIKEDVIIFPNVTVFPNTEIGARVLIHAGTVLGDDGFGYVWDGTQHYKIPQVGRVIIEDDVEVGANAAIDRATTGVTRIGKGTKIDNMVQVGHNVEIGKFCILCGQVGLGGSTKIGEGAMLGGQSGVADHGNVPAMARIGAKTGVTGRLTTSEPVFGTPPVKGRDFFKAHAVFKRLPELHKRIQKLEAEVEKLSGHSEVRRTEESLL